MVNTTDLYWTADGQSLNTWAWNISTLAGRMSPPEMRGEDRVIPYAPGEEYVPKVVGSRTLTLAMWIKGSTADGAVPLTARDAFDDNWAALVKLLWTPGRQFNLGKQFKRGGVQRYAVAKAEFVGGLEPSMIGRNGAKFTVDLKLADPYFYDDVATTFTLTSLRANYDLPGDARTHNIEWVIDGPRGPLELINWTNGQSAKMLRATASNETMRAQINKWEALRQVDGGGQNDISSLMTHLGDPFWFGMNPGINDIQRIESAPTGGGVITLNAKGAWL